MGPSLLLRSHLNKLSQKALARPPLGGRKDRALLARYQEKAANYLGLLQFACVLIWFKQYYRLTNIYASPGSIFLDILQDRNEAYASE